MSDDRPIIAVLGASGSQGSSVVRALAEQGRFRVRAITRRPDAYSGPADEVVAADLNQPATLEAAFDGAHGAFAVSNFWEPGSDEIAQGRNAVDAAAKAGVRHYVWSTLPNVEAISGGRYEVAHFTSKAKVDQFVRDAGFTAYTFVEAPFYFENLVKNMPPQPLPDGSTGWALPLAADARVVHMGSIEDLGGVVAGAFAQPDAVGAGAYLSSAAGLMSLGDVADTLNAQGHSVAVMQVPGEVFATFFPGAEEMAQMMGYWQEYTYLGPDADEVIAAARRVSTTSSTDFATWAKEHMPA
ncbi:MAG TPA: NmrA/HSCARG family protein [Actinomycetes bacterium]